MQPCTQKLLAAKSYEEAHKILETNQAGPAALKMLQWAFALKPTQPAYANEAMQSLVQELEGTGKAPDLPKNGSQEPPTKELNESGGDGEATGSSSQDGTKKEGKKGEVTDLESASGESQLKESYPPMDPQLMNQCLQSMQGGGQMPAGMPTGPQMQQMRYTVQEALKPLMAKLGPLIQEIERVKKAQVALDGKVKETLAGNHKEIPLHIPAMQPPNHKVQESKVESGVFGNLNIPVKSFNRFKTQETRQRISELNNQLHDGGIRPDDLPYQ